jgi:hypothetical protein
MTDDPTLRPASAGRRSPTVLRLRYEGRKPRR